MAWVCGNYSHEFDASVQEVVWDGASFNRHSPGHLDVYTSDYLKGEDGRMTFEELSKTILPSALTGVMGLILPFIFVVLLALKKVERGSGLERWAYLSFYYAICLVGMSTLLFIGGFLFILLLRWLSS